MGVVVFFVAVAIVVLVVVALLKSVKTIGATEVGLVTKRFGLGKLSQDNPIAFHGEAGYQAQLLMPGLRFKLWPMFGVKKFPWVQVPAGEIGVACRASIESMRNCGVWVATGYCTPFCGLSQKFGAAWADPESEMRRLLATSRWVRPTWLARVRSTVTLNAGALMTW